ncbi:hypothetical protein SO802_017955 [Lithocarpus litseifolius]|uniref:DUF3741 domain-containing protein n=1 Tax=Lithocarpus litseifolius TaxID=425828 RepID=A0AAW2CJM3_9ROSI
MKLLSSSPSFSSCSSTTTSFDANMCNSKSATAGCLAGLLRRILCSGNLPTHPSDQIKEVDCVLCDKDHELKAKENIETTTTPGIVARLMGLESMPEINLLHNSNPNSISRSRSMNSADHLAGFDQMQGQHRRVNSTLSFRELPTFLELENENFLVLSFENGGERKELRSELKQRRAEICKNSENRTERLSEKNKKKNYNKGDQGTSRKVLNDLNEQEKQSKRISVSDKPVEKVCNNVKESTITTSPAKNSHEKPHVVASEAVKSSKPVSHNEVFHNGKPRRKKKKKKTSPCLVQLVESDCSSEDSSPVSVLKFDHFLFDPQVSRSEEDSSLADSRSRRKLSPELENYKQQSPRKDNNLIGDDEMKTKKIEGKYHGTKKKECHSQNYKEMWGEILTLTGAELVHSNWVYGRIGKHQDFEDIGANIELEILDRLLDELVGQLVGLP